MSTSRDEKRPWKQVENEFLFLRNRAKPSWSSWMSSWDGMCTSLALYPRGILRVRHLGCLPMVSTGLARSPSTTPTRGTVYVAADRSRHPLVSHPLFPLSSISLTHLTPSHSVFPCLALSHRPCMVVTAHCTGWRLPSGRAAERGQ